MVLKWRWLAGLLLLMPGCKEEPAGFQLTDLVHNGHAGYRLNERVVLRFSHEIDASSINGRTVTIVDDAMGEASGEWTVKGRELAFLPRIPVEGGGKDSGLKPGRTYTVRLEGFPSHSAVRSTEGDYLDHRYHRSFETVSSEEEGFGRYVDLNPESGPKLVKVQGISLKEIGWKGTIVEAGTPLKLEFSKPLFPLSVALSRAQLNVVNQEGVVDRDYDLLDLRCTIIEQAQDFSLIAVEPVDGFQEKMNYKLWRESLDFVDFGGKPIDANRFNYLSIQCVEDDRK